MSSNLLENFCTNQIPLGTEVRFIHNSILVVIPARAGSKGVVDKNLQEVQGIPLVARAIRTALAVSRECLVTVSTDSDKIADLAGAEGALVLRRAESIAGDAASSESAVLDVLDQLQVGQERFLPNITLMMQCTSPFTTVEDIESVIEGLEDFDSVFTGTPDHSFRWNVGNDSSVAPVNHDVSLPRKRRQDLAEVVRETGGVYGFHTNEFLLTKNRFCGAVGVVMVPSLRALEIDSPSDLEMARRLAPMMADVCGMAKD